MKLSEKMKASDVQTYAFGVNVTIHGSLCPVVSHCGAYVTRQFLDIVDFYDALAQDLTGCKDGILPREAAIDLVEIAETVYD